MKKIEEKYPDLEKLIVKLNQQKDEFHELLKHLILKDNPKKIMSLEFGHYVFNPSVSRSIHLTDAILDTVSKWNIAGSIPLMRCLLENLAFFTYLTYTNQKWNKKITDFMKHGRLLQKNGNFVPEKQLIDYLKTKVTKELSEKVDIIYEIGSSFTHFSTQHSGILVKKIDFNPQIDGSIKKEWHIGIGEPCESWSEQSIRNFLEDIILINENMMNVMKDAHKRLVPSKYTTK